MLYIYIYIYNKKKKKKKQEEKSQSKLMTTQTYKQGIKKTNNTRAQKDRKEQQ